MIGFIVNPRAANGKTGKIWPELKLELTRHFGDSFVAAVTEYPLHAVELTRNLLSDGIETIIAIGGDGTLNEVLNGFFHKKKMINPRALLGTISIGTGGDFVRSLEWPKNISAAIERIKKRNIRKIDIGRTEYRDNENKTEYRYFINIADFGLGGAVVDKVNRTTKIWGGKISFLWGIIATLFSYRNKEISFKLGDEEWQTKKLNLFVAGNGRYFGGGLNPTPHAEIADGFFDVITVGDTGFFEVIKNLAKLRKGKHLDHPKVRSYRAKKIHAKSDETVLIDLDGEFVGRLPIKIEILPQVVNMLS